MRFVGSKEGSEGKKAQDDYKLKGKEMEIWKSELELMKLYLLMEWVNKKRSGEKLGRGEWKLRKRNNWPRARELQHRLETEPKPSCIIYYQPGLKNFLTVRIWLFLYSASFNVRISWHIAVQQCTLLAEVIEICAADLNKATLNPWCKNCYKPCYAATLDLNIKILLTGENHLFALMKRITLQKVLKAVNSATSVTMKICVN